MSVVLWLRWGALLSAVYLLIGFFGMSWTVGRAFRAWSLAGGSAFDPDGEVPRGVTERLRQRVGLWCAASGWPPWLAPLLVWPAWAPGALAPVEEDVRDLVQALHRKRLRESVNNLGDGTVCDCEECKGEREL